MIKTHHAAAFTSAILMAVLLFIAQPPQSFADHTGCSGINYFSCVTGGGWGSVAGGGYINDPSAGGVCSCSGCLCVSSQDAVQSGSGSAGNGGDDYVNGYNDGTVGNFTYYYDDESSDEYSSDPTGYSNWDDFYSGFYNYTDPNEGNVTGGGSADAGSGSGGGADLGGGGTGDAVIIGTGHDPTIGDYFIYSTPPSDGSDPDRLSPNPY